MIKTKIYRVLERLDMFQLNRLEKFITSPYFNTNSHLVNLFGILKSMLRPGSDEQYSKQNVWAQLFPVEEFRDPRFRKLCNDLLQLIEAFFIAEQMNLEPLSALTLLLDAVQQEKQVDLYKSSLSKVRNQLSKSIHRDAAYYLLRYHIDQCIYHISQSNLQRFEIANIEEILEDLDAFYISEKLRLHCEILSRRTFRTHDYHNKFIDPILTRIEAGDFRHITPVQVFYQIILTHLFPDDTKHYFQLKDLLGESAHLLPPNQMKEAYDSALNYCNRQINRGKKEFLRESFILYKTLLKKEMIYIDGQITHWTFKNVISIALRLEEFAWTKEFIVNYGHKIPEKYRANAMTYNFAQLHFYQGNYPKVLELLQEVEYDDVTYNLGAKSMLLATYYELQEWDPLFSLADSFRIYLNRKKQAISERRRINYINLVKFVTKLAKLLPNQKEQVIKLELALNKEPGVASEKWLREKIQEKKGTVISRIKG